jgi:hypothetical protein
MTAHIPDAYSCTMAYLAPANPPTVQTDPKSRRPRWSWAGGLTLVAACWQLIMHAKASHLTFDGYDYGPLLSILPVLFLVGLLAPLASYRRRDAFLIFVPFYNLVVLWRIGSRLARLPERDWPQRPGPVVAAAPTLRD